MQIVSWDAAQRYPIRLSLAQRPTAAVDVVGVGLPPGAELQPPRLRIAPERWNMTQEVTLLWRDAMPLHRPYQFNLYFHLTGASAPQQEDLAYVAVTDARGETADNPLVRISAVSLPVLDD